jgi:sirohydrochlorin cobaltochelatase
MRDEGNCALILFAHGSRDPQWAEPFRAIRQRVSALKRPVTVELAFLEIMQPSLVEVVDRLAAGGCVRFTIAPLFMASGAHLKRDLAETVDKLKTRHAGVELAVLPAVGEADEILDAISTWLVGQI